MLPCLKDQRGTWRFRGLSKSVISRVIIRVTPFRVLRTLPITHLTKSPGPPSAGSFKGLGCQERAEVLVLGFKGI